MQAKHNNIIDQIKVDGQQAETIAKDKDRILLLPSSTTPTANLPLLE